MGGEDAIYLGIGSYIGCIHKFCTMGDYNKHYQTSRFVSSGPRSILFYKLIDYKKNCGCFELLPLKKRTHAKEQSLTIVQY